MLQGVDECRGGRRKSTSGTWSTFKPGLVELSVRVGVGPGFLAQPAQDLSGGRVGEQSSLGIGVDVELDLADAQARELLGQRAVGVVESPRPGGGRWRRSAPGSSGAGAMWYELWLPMTWIWFNRGSSGRRTPHRQPTPGKADAQSQPCAAHVISCDQPSSIVVPFHDSCSPCFTPNHDRLNRLMEPVNLGNLDTRPWSVHIADEC